MDYAILWLTARIGLFKTSWIRLGTAAMLGALYATVFFLPFGIYLTPIYVKIVFSLLMLVVAFALSSPRGLIRAAVYFYLSSFGVGGFIFGLSYLFYNDSVHKTSSFAMPQNYTWPEVPLALVVIWLVGRAGGAYLKRRWGKALLKLPVTIFVSNKHRNVNALLDTGNQLSDPVTGYPVIVAEYDAIAPLLPPEARDLYEKDQQIDLEAVLATVKENDWSTRLRVIPYQSLGCTGGLLLGFRPDRIEIDYDRQRVCTKNVVVAVYHKQLSPESSYNALLNPCLLETPTGLC